MRYLINISYDGTNYSGYQKQNNKITIQETIENVLSQIFKQEITIVASGRTDAGVSAIEQVCHMDINVEFEGKKVLGYANSLLPADIRINVIKKVESEFHARYSAKRKTYEYYFYVGQHQIPVYDKFASRVGYVLDIENMKKACEEIKGEHDFSCFCASNTSIKDKTRTVYEIDIKNVDGCLYKLEITGNGFLYNMVRIIMGTLIDVGVGKININDIKNIINGKDRSKAGKTANSKGLYLKKVDY